MMRRGEKAFTVAGLLVTVAIIAVLAAMVVPVFEARSEEARTLTCQSNMQRIVTAIRMYMADHDDTLPPTEHRQEVLDYFTLSPGPAAEDNPPAPYLWCAWQSNPYLRWPVLLESYVRRDVWQCPSAAIVGGGMWIIPGPDWFAYVEANESLWADGTYEAAGPCRGAWPTGWGGTVTDSIMQRQLGVQDAAPIYGGVASGAFIQSIGTTWWPELTLGEVADTSKFVIAGDAGVQTMDLGAGTMAYPEICWLECGNCARWADWEECADLAADCGLFRCAPNDGSFLRNVSLRTPYARHRGRFSTAVPMWERNGVNIGFLDGHVRWIASEALVDDAREGRIEGVRFWGPPSGCSSPEEWITNSGGQPTLW